MEKLRSQSAEAWLKVIPKNEREEVQASIVTVSGDDMLQLLLFKRNGKSEAMPVQSRCMRFRPAALRHLREAVDAAETLIGGR